MTFSREVVVNRLKYGYDTAILNKAFVNTLFLKARAISQHSLGMFASNNDKPVKLSPRQKEILIYLSQSFSYRETSEKTGVKVSMVNDYTRKIYAKPSVSNAYDAVMKASEGSECKSGQGLGFNIHQSCFIRYLVMKTSLKDFLSNSRFLEELSQELSTG